jgi:hypothetical protein
MMKVIASISVMIATLMPTTALAYVGPGAGLSLLGALWALLAAFATVIAFILLWPIRRALRRRRAAGNAAAPVKDRAEPMLDSPDGSSAKRGH